MSKKQVFKSPFFGFDDFGEYDVLNTMIGNPVIGIKIKNIVKEYSADSDLYLKYHKVLNQVVNMLGEGYIFQKMDIFNIKEYSVLEDEEEYLQQKYSEHFQGRKVKEIDTILTFTFYLDNTKKKVSYETDKKKEKVFREKIEKIFLVLDQNEFKPNWLKEKDWTNLYFSYLNMDFNSEVKYRNNMKSYNTHLEINNKFTKVIDLVDVEEIQLPNVISPFTNIGGSGASRDTPVDNFSFLSGLDSYNCFIYNQVIAIPMQMSRNKQLKKKRERHLGFRSDVENLVIAEEIDELVINVAKDNQLIVDSYFGIILTCDDEEKLDKNVSLLESLFFQKGIVVSEQSYNQFELFYSSIPGNINLLKDYNYFESTSEASLCFFFKESYPVDEESNIYLRFTDRQGVPLKVDLSDLPQLDGRINNRNKFVLGPSGSGKSFLMNNIVEQNLLYNYDVVIVDVGDSYSGLAKYYDAKYIQYKEEDPISMNPFNISLEEKNIEKTEFLASLIYLIWEGVDGDFTTTKKSILDNTIESYYNNFFKKGREGGSFDTIETLTAYLNRYNFYEDDLREIYITEEEEEEENYYGILELPFDAEKKEIRKAFRKKALILHPDVNKDNKDYNDDDYKLLYEAYETLSDDELRKKYDEQQLALIIKKDISKEKNRKIYTEEDEHYKNWLIKKIHTIEKECVIKELSFNSFYEYCEWFLPIYLNNKKHRINEEEFNIRTFMYVLKDFYKGGKYDKTLNKDSDKSLFYEKFIVFEIDNVKDNPKLFPIVTLIIMDTFIQKMRMREGRRKALIIEEAWKAIASKLMGNYILYLYKTVRKFWGECIVVTQELNDILGNPVVKDSIINNSDTILLLDQTKFKDNFEEISDLLSLNKVERSKIFTINNLNNKSNRSRFKEFYLKRGSVGEVYGNEVSIQQYLTYTTEKPEKTAIEVYIKNFGSYQEGLEEFLKDLKVFDNNLNDLKSLININKKVINKEIYENYLEIRKKYPKGDLEKLMKKTNS